jgi:hypothetical protein
MKVGVMIEEIIIIIIIIIIPITIFPKSSLFSEISRRVIVVSLDGDVCKQYCLSDLEAV